MSNNGERMTLAEADRLIGSIVNNLNSATADMVARIPESTFVTYFLPLFSGEEPHPDRTAAEWLDAWRDIAGIHFMPVNVVDTDGSILYQVPPLLDRHAVSVGEKIQGTPSMASMVQTAQQYAQIHPGAGENYILRQLRNYNLLGKISPQLEARISAWNVIFKRYDKPQVIIIKHDNQFELKLEDKPASKASSAPRGGGDDDGFEY